MTNSAISSRENPSALAQDRQSEFSNVRCCPHFGQVKSRIVTLAVRSARCPKFHRAWFAAAVLCPLLVLPHG